MAKLQLNNAKRDFLRGEAEKHIDPKELKDKAKKASDLLHKNLLKHIEKMASVAELKTLEKFDILENLNDFPFTMVGVAGQTHEKTIQFPNDFLPDGIRWIKTQKRRYYGQSIHLGEIKANSHLGKAWTNAAKTNEEYRNTRRSYKNKMFNLINKAKFLEDIIPAWEGAESYRDKLSTGKGSTALAVLSVEDIATLRNLTKGKPDNKNDK